MKHFQIRAARQRASLGTPEAPEIQACRFWLDVELIRLRPKLVVAMGGTAARPCWAGWSPSPEARSSDRAAGRTNGIRHRAPIIPTAGTDERREGAGDRAFVADLRKVVGLVG